MNITRHFTSVMGGIGLVLGLGLLPARANVAVTPASGGSVSADTAANAATPAWTSLGSITIAEQGSNRGDIGGGTLVLKAPNGFEFNTAVTPDITYTGNRNISAASVAVTDSSTLTITLTVTGSDKSDSFSIGKTTPVQVRPTSGTPLADGNLYRPATGGGTATIVGLVASSDPTGAGGTSLGALIELVGAAKQIALVTAPPATAIAGALFAPQPVLQIQDQFGTARTAANGGADNTTVVSAALGLGAGALQGTTNRTASNGTVTYTDLACPLVQTISLIFQSGTLVPTNSGTIVVSQGQAERLMFVTQPGGAIYGSLLSPQPSVKTTDRYGNDSILGLASSKLVALTLSAGTGALQGTNVLDIGTAAGNGLVTFSGLAVSAAGAGKQLTASTAGFTNAVSSSFTITPVTVIGSVTVSNKVYDGTTAASIATRSLSGVLGSDQVTLAGGVAVFANDMVGTNKAVTATGLSLSGAQAANYQLDSTSASTTASITPAALTVKADNQSRLYGATNPPLTVTYSGFAAGETLTNSGVTGAPVVTTTADVTSLPGSYPITVITGTLTAQNYTFTPAAGTLTVSKATLLVVADSLWRVYGVANPPLTVTYSGFASGDGSNSISGNPTVTTTATVSSPLGSYPITVQTGTLASAKYSFVPVNGTLAVQAAGTLWYDGFARAGDPGSLAPWIAQSGLWSVTGGILKGGTNTVSSYGMARVTNVWSDYFVQGRVQLPVGAYGGGLGGRLDAGTGARYAAWIYPETSPGNSNVLKVLKFQNATTFTVVQQTALASVGTNWHTLKLGFQGDRVAVHYDGTRLISVLDTDVQAPTNGTIDAEFWTDAVGYAMAFDDVLVSVVRAPFATNDAYSVAQGATLTVPDPGMLTNDASDVGDLTAVLASGPTKGVLNLSTNGGFSYTPNAGASGTDTFTYRANDGVSNSATATVTITITANTRPVANNDTNTVMSGTVLIVPAPGVLANDTDPNGQPLTAVLATSPTHGTLILNTNGGYTYSPAAYYTGTDSFTYRASDGLTNSTAATVTISITAFGTLFSENFTRTNNPGTLAPWINQAGTWTVTGGSLRAGSNTPASYGYVYLTNVWTDYALQARLRFASNGFGGGVGGRLDPTTGARYAVWVYPEGSAGGGNTLKLLKFQDWLGFSLMQQATLPGVGTNWHTVRVVFQGARLAVYYDGARLMSLVDPSPLAALGGIDLELWTDTTGYNMYFDDVQVTPPRFPGATNDAYTVVQGSSLTVSPPGVLTNDTNEFGGLIALAATAPAHGSVNLATNGGFTYTPVVTYSGADSFNYRVSDGVMTSQTATVSFTISADRPPVASNDTYTAYSGYPLVVAAPGVLVNDSDPDGQTLSALLVSGPTNGTLTLSSNGGFTYLAPSNYTGADAFTYRASDGISNSSPAKVSITVVRLGPLFSDNFTRTNDPGTLSPWVVQAGLWTVTGGVLRTASNSVSSYAYVYVPTNWGDYTFQARLRFPAGGYGGGFAGRLNAATGARYAAWVYPEGSPGGALVLKLLKFSDWTTFSTLGQAALPAVGTNWHTVQMTFLGSTISLSFDGSQLFSATDASQPNLSGGIGAEIWTDAAPYTFYVDDVQVTLPSLVTAPKIVGITPNSTNRTVTLAFTGASLTTYVVQAATNLTAPIVWVPVATNVSDSNGAWSFTDSTSARPVRFYRAATP